MDDYKGIYYKETKEQKYYEGGAHFPYKVLFNILLDLGGIVSHDEYNYNYSTNEQNLLLLKEKEERIRNKYKTRNFDQHDSNYKNNPNTLIKYSSQNILNNKENDKKNYVSRNVKNSSYNNNIYLSKRNYGTSINIHLSKKNTDNHLLQILLNKKAKEKQNEEKNNDESSNDNRYSIINFYRNIHLRNRSQLSNNISNTKIIKINKNDKLVENSKNDFKDYIRKKINIIKSFETNKRSLEINGNNKEVNNEKEIINNNNKNISEIQNNSRVEPFLSYFDNISKKSRNIVNNNLIEYNNTCENNKHLGNNNTLFKTSNNNIKQENKINKGFIFKLTKDKNNLSNRFRNSIFQTNIINNKEINIQPKNFILQKYKKKKINQICCFNHDNGKTKSGNNIFAKNINKINIIHSKGIIQ